MATQRSVTLGVILGLVFVHGGFLYTLLRKTSNPPGTDLVALLCLNYCVFGTISIVQLYLSKKPALKIGARIFFLTGLSLAVCYGLAYAFAPPGDLLQAVGVTLGWSCPLVLTRFLVSS